MTQSYPSVHGKKHLYMWQNGNDYVIAETVDDARLFTAKTYFGETANEWAEPCSWGCYIDHSKNLSQIDFEDIDGDGWEIFPVDKEFTLVLEDNTKQSKSVQDWIEEHGEGYFASVECQMDSHPTVTVRDENGKILTQWEADPKNYCQGSRTGSIGDLCGGCGFCMEMQAAYSGLIVEYEETEEVI